MIELVGGEGFGARIKVVGVGGGGGNAVNTMIAANLQGVEFLVANTDAQALKSNRAAQKLQLGEKGLGAGANPEVGREAAEANVDHIRELLTGADMIFITAGMGGGTGTGGAPVIGRLAREVGSLTVGVVTKPFQFEGKKRMKQAEAGLEELKRSVDTLIVIPNQRLLATAGRDTAMIQAFARADDILLQAVRGISDLVTVHGLINLDFADVRTIMAEMGMAIMGSGVASGENRAVEAAQKAISSPLLEDLSIRGARGVLINITGSPDLALHEVNDAATLIQEEAHEDANIIFGAVIDEAMGEELRVTVIATGFGEEAARPAEEEKVTMVRPAAAAAGGNGRFAQRGFASRFNTPAPVGRPVRRVGSIVDEGGEPRFQAAVGEEPSATGPVVEHEFVIGGDEEEDYDTPAFLRRQAE
jgi:cell division protein FtsZ